MTVRCGWRQLLWIALAFTLGCEGSTSSSPLSPGDLPSSLLTRLAGNWIASSSAAATDQCSRIEYSVTPEPDGRSATVQFTGTCGGASAIGSGSGTVVGDTLEWTAEGTATREDITCPFRFENSTATLEGDGLRVVYRAVICGVPLSGSELLRRPN